MPNPVKPIPDNFHSLTPNLVCRNAAQAIEFYKAVFGATELMRMPGPGGKIMHAELQIGDSRFFVNDTMSKSMPDGPEPGASNPCIFMCMSRRWTPHSTVRLKVARESICPCKTCSGETVTAS